MIGDIMTISRLRMGTDGNGLTTLVTFFDCPLHCKYCANDFCHDKNSMVYSVPRGSYRPEELVEKLKKDEIYYLMSGGGITFGGGEPLLQSSFIHEACKLMNPKWKKRIETSLNVPWQCVEPILEDIDEWIIDIKDMDRDIYKEYTGADNEKVINNLCRLNDLVDSSKLHIRIPRIPSFNNEEHIQKSVEWIRNVMHVEPEVFHYFILPHTTKTSKWILDDYNE